jgi:hypothetical protein
VAAPGGASARIASTALQPDIVPLFGALDRCPDPLSHAGGTGPSPGICNYIRGKEPFAYCARDGLRRWHHLFVEPLLLVRRGRFVQCVPLGSAGLFAVGHQLKITSFYELSLTHLLHYLNLAQAEEIG